MTTGYKILAALLFLSAVPAAATEGPLHAHDWYGAPINGTGLDASSTSFTITPSENPERNGIHGLMTVWVTITDANDSVTAINMSCVGMHTKSGTEYTLQDITVASGVGTSVDASWTKNPAAIASPKSWPWRVDIEGFPHVKCTFTDTGGNSSDTIGVTLTFSTKGS